MLKSSMLKIYYDFARREKLLHLEQFIKESPILKEIPIHSDVHYHQFLKKKQRRKLRINILSFIKKKHSKLDIQSFLINISYFHLNSIKLYARMKLTDAEYRNFFICLTFQPSRAPYVIPNLLVTREASQVTFLNENGNSYQLNDYPLLKERFENLGLFNVFDFIKIESNDNNADFKVYALIKSDREKLNLDYCSGVMLPKHNGS